VPLSSSSII